MISYAKLGTAWRTIVHLRGEQLLYLCLYRILRFKRFVLLRKPQESQIRKLSLVGMLSECSYIEGDSITILNLSVFDFLKNPNWEYEEHGKLFSYNLNYFDFLEELSWEKGVFLMTHFCSVYTDLAIAKEPYPTGLRIINWCKFLSKYPDKEYDKRINEIMWRDTSNLARNIEYHLGANHLLENGFALLYASYFFRHEKIRKISERLLMRELNEQFHSDGGHFEQSLMYHAILLERMFDAMNLLMNNNWDDKPGLLGLLSEKAQSGINFLSVFTKVDELPKFNDAAEGVAKPASWLTEYALKLGIVKADHVTLNESGFRRLRSNELEVFVDFGAIGPRYQPGHAHADSTTFCLYHRRQPIIVDTGTSTYTAGSRRDIERSTSSHNTIVVNGENSSEVWGGFRVGRRATCKILEEREGILIGVHDGYKRFDLQHHRKFECSNSHLKMSDQLSGKSPIKSESMLHFYPKVQVSIEEDRIIVNNGDLVIKCFGFMNINLEKYEYCESLNSLQPATRFKGEFHKSCRLEFFTRANDH